MSCRAFGLTRSGRMADLVSRQGPLTNHHLPQNHAYPSRGTYFRFILASIWLCVTMESHLVTSLFLSFFRPSTIYSASSFHSLPPHPSYEASPIEDSFIDLASPPMSPTESHESKSAKPASSHNSPRSSNPHSRSASPLPKPPIPTTPKPVFNRPYSLRRSVDGRPRVEDFPPANMTAAERAGLVKKTRKIAQLFGQIPGPDITPSRSVISPLQRSLLSPDARKGHRAIASISNTPHPSDRGVWPPPEDTVYLNINGRRHSTPLSPTNTSVMWGLDEDDSVLDADRRSSFSKRSSRARSSRSSPMLPAPSPASFIDLSESDSAAETPKDIIDHRHQAPFSQEAMTNDTDSLLTLTPSQIYEEERRRKREKIVKLHRFLGSRVPADLVLGLDLTQSPKLPPPASPETGSDDTRKKFRMRRRRSNSYSGYTKPLTTQEDRMKSDLDIQEKALNVRRAAKMEKVGTVQSFRVDSADRFLEGVWNCPTTNTLPYPKIGLSDPAESKTSPSVICGH